jgi:hypothetical protein
VGYRARECRAGAAGLALVAAMLVPAAPRAEVLAAGGFSFSDELGGFRLVSVSGRGTRDDPVVIVEEIEDVGPAVLVIRRLRRPSPKQESSPGATHALSLVKVVTNRSGNVWAGFDLELQEDKDVPSVYGDGLSFDQIGRHPSDLRSDRFAQKRSRFEPYDRLTFEGGHVDPQGEARFSLTITDPTPTAEFYLLQDPRLLYAEGPGGRIVTADRRQGRRSVLPATGAAARPSPRPREGTFPERVPRG